MAQSLVGLLDGGEGATRRDPIYYHRISALQAVRDGRFKYHDRHGVFYGNPMELGLGANVASVGRGCSISSWTRTSPTPGGFAACSNRAGGRWRATRAVGTEMVANP